MFWEPKDSAKGKFYVFRSYKQKNRVPLACLECTLQKNVGLVD